MELDLGLLIAGLVAIGISAQWLAWRWKLPSILLLLGAGFALGPLLGVLSPESMPHDQLFPLVSLGVAVILFEGALNLRVRDLRGHGAVVRNLISIGALANGTLVALAAWKLGGLAPEIAALFGAILTVTGPTVIAPLLRVVRPTPAVANVLQWEGILIDPLGAILALLVYELVAAGHAGEEVALSLARVLGTGAFFGAIGAFAIATSLRRRWVPEHLHDVGALALVLLLFALSNALQHESGLLTVTVMGVLLANAKGIDTSGILHFKESLTLLLVSVLFLVLAARIDPRALQELGGRGLLVLAAVILIARPVGVLLSSWRSGLSWRERVLIAWIGPRGIVAAAVTSIFALRLEELGHPQAQLLVPLTFTVIIGTVVLQGLSARALARALGVAEPALRGVLVLGANQVGLALAKALQATGRRVIVADTSWEQIAEARMAGLETYFGSLVSEHADQHLDLFGVGRFLGCSRRPELNQLTCVHFARELGRSATFTLAQPRKTDAPEARSAPPTLESQRLFGEDVTYSSMAAALSRGAQIRTTKLRPEFDFATYKKREGQRVLPLFATDLRGRLYIFAVGSTWQPQVGWTVIGLVESEATPPA
ncbi:MAG: sodium:proton antiporter [Planctomycetes bacterium]|nr:sodium:proton antiporter [Planctomycetota bacterium]